MGFRGEALASIASVSEVQIHSWNEVDEMGMVLIKKPGEDIDLSPKARNRGTTITVAHLFKSAGAVLVFKIGNFRNKSNYPFGATVLFALSRYFILIKK